jgi:uncharacterized RDD family membrane protein YckC
VNRPWIGQPKADAVVVAEPLNVAPALVGARLASPSRRLYAFIVDGVLIALLTSVSALWLVAGLALLLAQLVSPRGGEPRGRGKVAAVVGGAVLAMLAVNAMYSQWSERREQQLAKAQAIAAAESRVAGSAAVASAPVPALSASQRIALLEARIEALEDAQPRSIRDQVMAQLDDIGLSYGWAIVYFSLLPAWWRGQTVGKRLLKLRVVELTGKPMTVLRSLRRFGGYAASMATFGLGFLQMLRDPNRQGLQDRAAHTVVLDERPAAP